MLRNKLVRSDGSIIDSSVIISCEFTEEVNSSTNLSVGDVTASELTVEILAADIIQQDEVLTYYVIEDGVETKIGVFNAEKPTVATRTSMRFTAYDNIVKTEKIFSDWLRENQSLFPMTLVALVGYACSHCGVTLVTMDFPNADLSVDAFYADNLTCRQILNWAGSIAGRFIRANADGKLEFAWYKDAANVTVRPQKVDAGDVVALTDDGEGNVSISSGDIVMTDDGEGNLDITSNSISMFVDETNFNIIANQSLPYFQGSLKYENYTTDLIERVQINHSEDDVGVIYPADATGNCFTVSENMILGVSDSTNVTRVASDLYSHLKNITYVPFSATIPRTIMVRAGDVINVVDSTGHAFTSCVMKVSLAAGGTTISSTGDKSYGSNAAVASEKYSNLTGKILAIKKSIDGLSIKNEDLAGRLGSLELSTESFKTEVRDTYVSSDEFGEYKNTVSSEFVQTAEDFEFKFTTTSDEIAGVKKDVVDEHNERVSYIRFEDGNIILGKTDSDILLIQRNNKISFVRNDSTQTEIAWFADDILHVNEGEFLTQLRIGKFGFIPGANGNLSFKKVVS